MQTLSIDNTQSPKRLPRELNLKSFQLGLIAIFFFALVLRIGAIASLESWKYPNPMEHRGVALALLRGDGFSFNEFNHYGPSSVQSPPYPLLLASLFSIFGPDSAGAYTAAMIINAFAGALSCVVTGLLAQRLGASFLISLVGAALVAIWPTQVYAVTVAQAISLITLCTVCVMWLFYVSVDTQRILPWLGYSLIGCLGALTEPVLLPFMALSGLLILFWPKLAWSIRLRNAAILFLSALLVIGPWSYRNYRVHGKFVPVKNTVWVNIWKGANPHATGTDRLPMTDEMREQLKTMTDAQKRDATFDSARQYDKLTEEQLRALNKQPEIVREQLFHDWAVSWIKANPKQWAQLCVARLGKTLWIEWDNPKGEQFYFISRTILLAASAVGFVFAFFHRWRMLIPILVMGTGVLTYTLTIAAARFAFPYEPWQLILASLAIIALATKFGLFEEPPAPANL
ncbi:MAG TPA: hypothetical protein PK402_04660 [Tepidisphaeraceae bacterium]|nr:hypothetical protein [Tepidisphaeraceae bacterium]